MGGGSWDHKAWAGFKSTKVDGKKADKIYTSRTMDTTLSPLGVIRESRDSDTSPASTPIILGLDVTGSMSMVLEAMMKGMGVLVGEIYNRKPVTNPHILCAGIGDAEAGDKYPLQVTQFEADIRMVEQLIKIYLEMGGGGNSFEGYGMLQYFAATRTSIDCFEKRGKKGYLFTIGDEEPTPRLRIQDIERVLGVRVQADISAHDVFTMVNRMYNVFHVVVEEGSHCHHRGAEYVAKKWSDILGTQRVIRLSDHTKLAEVIVSTLQVCNGDDIEIVSKSWDGTTNIVVKDAIRNLKKEDDTEVSDVVMF